MKYYVLEVSEGDTKIAGKAVYEYEDIDAAEASYHQKIATAMNSALYTSHNCFVLDSEGNTDFSHTFKRKVTA